MDKNLKSLIKTTKRKNVVFGPTNLKQLEGREAAILTIPSLKQVTVTFSFPNQQAAEEFFATFT